MNSDSISVKQPRAQRTRMRLLEGLERLLLEQEFEHIAVADIAREAGVAVGSVYSHFRDKTAFLEALLEARLDNIEERTEAAQANLSREALPQDLAPAVRLAVQSAHDQVLKDAHVLRALQTYARLSGSEHPRSEKLAQAALLGIRAFLEYYRDDVSINDIDEAARVVNRLLNSAFADRVMIRGGALPAGVMPTEKAYIDAVAGMLTAYLRGA